MSGLLSVSPVDVQEAHEYNRAIQVCNTDFYWTLVTSSYCVSYRRLAINCVVTLSVALAVDKRAGVTDELTMLRDQLASRDNAVTLANTELDAVWRQIEQVNKKYQTALQKYESQ